MASNVVVNVISRADGSGFAKASRSLAKFSALAAAAAPAAAGAAQAVGAIAVAGAAVGALALPALGAVVAGIEGIKTAAGTASGSMSRFRSAMSSSFAGMSTGFGQLGGVLDRITPQMGGVGRAITGVFNGLAGTIAANVGGLQSLATKSAEFVTRLGPGLNTLVEKAIQFAGAINVDALFNGFAQLWSLLQPIVTLFTELAGAAGPLGGTLGVLGGIITALTPPLVQMAQTVGPAIAEAMTRAAPAIAELGAAFADVVSTVAPLLPALAGVVAAIVSGLGPALPAIVAAVLAFGIGIKVLTAGLAAYKAIQAGITAATTAWTAVQWLLNSALLANPITWVVIAVVALIAVIVLIATKTTWFQTIWQAMCAAAVAAWNWIKSALSSFAGWIVGLWNRIVAGARAAWEFVRSIVSTVFGAIRSIVSAQINAVVAVFNRVRSVGQSVFGAIRSVIDTVGSAISTVVGWVQSLISAISNISWPSPPGWLSSIFGGLDPALMPGAAAYMTPAWAVQDPTKLHLAGGFPSLADLGGLGGGRPIIVQQDNSITVEVDGSGIVDAVAVGRQIERVLSKYRVTSGQRAAVQF
ncbi:tape measure protein [Gordonia phage Coeur]|uniref:Tape measure protein n=1 Tax=Gordonia phage Coeur TaxID=2571246 RepID=A0A4Y6EG05_9CAUD|nr:tail length tape measure protein [Gordonia phage Coeur]QDF17432.1 tape measure protein [Gordonia phage Coeur]